MTRKSIQALLAAAFAMLIPGVLQAQSGASKPFSPDYQPKSEIERSLWLAMDEEEQELKNSKFLVTDPALNSYVKSVLCNAVGADRCSAARIYILRTPQFNASMAPNGMMVVWTGLLLRTSNEAELASVLGHEFGHFENQHSLQSFRDISTKSDAISWLSFLPYGVGALGQMNLIGSVYSFNREMERQADMISLNYMVKNGYDPMAASQIWSQLRAEMDATAAERKTKSRKDIDGGFFASHPGTAERMEYLRLAAEGKKTVNSRNGAVAYRQAISAWWPKLIDDQVKLNDFGGTEFLLGQLASNGWTGQLLYARGELYRARGNEGDLVKAIGFYKQATLAKDAIPESWRGLGLALSRNGDGKAGQKALRVYLAKRPDAPDKAMIAMMAGDDA